MSRAGFALLVIACLLLLIAVVEIVSAGNRAERLRQEAADCELADRLGEVCPHRVRDGIEAIERAVDRESE